MRVGELRKQIALQSEQPVSDSAGGYTLSWTTVAIVWADIDPVNGNESYFAQHLEGRVTHRVTMRYRSDISVTTDMRILYGSRSFNIRAVINKSERNHWYELLVEEGAAV